MLVDMFRFFVAEGRACWGQVKHVAFLNIFKNEDSITETRVGTIACGHMFATWPDLQNPHQFVHIYISPWLPSPSTHSPFHLFPFPPIDPPGL